MKARLAILMIVAVALAGTGFFALSSLHKDGTDRAIELVPQDAFLYGHVFLKPSVDQRKAIRGLLEHFPKAPETDEVLDPFFGAIDDALEQHDMTYEEDVKPWLGDQAAFFMNESDAVAFLIATDDPGATKRFVGNLMESDEFGSTQESYKDVEYDMTEGVASAILDDFLVVGMEEGLRAVVDVQVEGGSLTASTAHADLEAELNSDRIFSLYLDLERLAEEAGIAGVPGLAGATGLSGVGPAMVAGYVQSDAVVMELAGKNGETTPVPGAVDLASGIPSDAWLAFGAADVGTTIQTSMGSVADASGTSIDALLGEFTAQTGFNLEADFLSWMGDLKVFVSGTGLLDFGGALSIESSDPAASGATIERLLSLAQAQGIQQPEPVEVAGENGFALPIPGSPQPLIVVPGERVLIAYGQASAREAVDPDESLGDSEGFRAATDDLGDGLEPAFFLDIDAVQQIVENFIPPSDIYVDDVKPWLDPIAHLITGSKLGDDSYLVRFVIGVE